MSDKKKSLFKKGWMSSVMEPRIGSYPLDIFYLTETPPDSIHTRWYFILKLFIRLLFFFFGFKFHKFIKIFLRILNKV